MASIPTAAQHVVIAGAATELGLEATRRFIAGGHTVTGLAPDNTLAERVRATGAEAHALDLTDADHLVGILAAAQPGIVLSLASQRANTLLHDGHKWRGQEQSIPAETSALLLALQTFRSGAADAPAPLLIYGSYAFLYGNARDAVETAPLTVGPLDPAFDAAIRAEGQVRAAGIPATILRLGYLYGPTFKDLALYVKAFRLHRLYWAGPGRGRANFLHVEDAAEALALVAASRPSGEVFNVVDGSPVSFANFMDYFARGYGFAYPRHVPTWSAGLARRFITSQHMRQAALVTTVNDAAFRRRFGWSPRYPNYHTGLDDTIRIMQASGITRRKG
jgi:nucleoside-diphosphate-sugar epimerase